MPFKSCAETGRAPRRGYHLGDCYRCGQRVVISDRTGLVLHSHWRSIKCREAQLPDDQLFTKGRR